MRAACRRQPARPSTSCAATTAAITIESATLRSEGVDLSATGALTPDFVPAERGDLAAARRGRPHDAALRAGRRLGDEPRPRISGSTTARLRRGAPISAPRASRAPSAASGAVTAHGKRRGRAPDRAGQPQRQRSASTPMRAASRRPIRRSPKRSVRRCGSPAAAPGRPASRSNFENLQAVLTGATASFAGTATGGRAGRALQRRASPISRASRRSPAGRSAGSAQLQADGNGHAVRAGFDLHARRRGDGSRARHRRARSAARRHDAPRGRRRPRRAARSPSTISRFRTRPSAARVSGDVRRPGPRSCGHRQRRRSLHAVRRASGRRDDRRDDRAARPPRREIEAESERRADRADGPAADGRDGALLRRRSPGRRRRGDAEISGSLDGVPVRGSARLSSREDGGAARSNDLLFSVGESRASGNLVDRRRRPAHRRAHVVSPDLSQVAPLFLVEASGMLQRRRHAVRRRRPAIGQHSPGSAADLVYENDHARRRGDFAARRATSSACRRSTGRSTLRNLTAGGLTVVTATGTAQRQGQSTGFSVDAAARRRQRRAARAASSRAARAGARAARRSPSRAPGVNLTLAAPTTIVVENGTARFDKTRLNVGGGSVTLGGSAGSSLNLSAMLSGVPGVAGQHLCARSRRGGHDLRHARR